MESAIDKFRECVQSGEAKLDGNGLYTWLWMALFELQEQIDELQRRLNI